MRKLQVLKLGGASGRLSSNSKRVLLKNGWEVELREREDVGRVELFGAAGAGLFRLRKAETNKYYRVLLRLPKLEPGEGFVRISYQGRAQTAAILEWGALLNEAADGGRQFVLRERLLPVSSAYGLAANIEGRLLTSYSGPYFVAFQFSTDPGEFVLERLVIEVGAAGALRRAELRHMQAANPHPLFDTAWYLRQLPSALDAGADPLTHYLLVGEAQGLSPHPLFDPRWYVAQLGERLRDGETALQHYLRVGAARGISPHPLFDARWYQQRRSGASDGQGGER